MPNPYDKTTHDGKTVDWITKAALLECERRLGYTLSLIQGSYNGTNVSASAGTHAGGGVIDLAPADWQNKVKVLRAVGFAAWHRAPIPGLWVEHIHAVLIGNTALAPAARAQVTDYFNHRDGLAGNRPDVTWHPNPIPTFKWAGAPTPKDPTVAARIDGIDISHWQSGPMDFGKAKAAGCRFVFHKATEGWGASGAVDHAYNTRRIEVHKAGLPFGAYHFARPRLSNGKAQAVFFLATARPRVGDMRPMLDLEDAGGLGRAALTRWVGDFVAEVVAQTGVPPLLYTNFDLDKTFDCPLWVARYSNAMSAPKIPAPWKTQTIWQFSDGAFGHPNTVPGIGACDINTMNGDPAALTKAFTLADKQPTNPAKPSTPTEPDMPLSDADIAKIAKAVAAIPVANKETNAVDRAGTLSGMVTRVDQNVDTLTAQIAALDAKLQAALDAGK